MLITYRCIWKINFIWSKIFIFIHCVWEDIWVLIFECFGKRHESKCNAKKVIDFVYDVNRRQSERERESTTHSPKWVGYCYWDCHQWVATAALKWGLAFILRHRIKYIIKIMQPLNYDHVLSLEPVVFWFNIFEVFEQKFKSTNKEKNCSFLSCLCCHCWNKINVTADLYVVQCK